MPGRAILREHFTEMRQAAEAAAGTYERVAEASCDPEAQQQLKRIAMDTSRQVELTERLLEIVSE